MPRLSYFHGIEIYMYTREHGVPHFHARYSGEKASISIDTLEVLAGRLSARALAFVRQWARTHQSELEADWLLARASKPVQPIPPLE